MFLLYLSCLKIFKKIIDQLLCHQTNIKISNFYDLKLCIKNKFFNQLVNNIRFERNLICMLAKEETWNSNIRFSKFTLNLKIYKGFEGFLSKVVWRETLFCGRGAHWVWLIKWDHSISTLSSTLLLLQPKFFLSKVSKT